MADINERIQSVEAQLTQILADARQHPREEALYLAKGVEAAYQAANDDDQALWSDLASQWYLDTLQSQEEEAWNNEAAQILQKVANGTYHDIATIANTAKETLFNNAPTAATLPEAALPTQPAQLGSYVITHLNDPLATVKAIAQSYAGTAQHVTQRLDHALPLSDTERAREQAIYALPYEQRMRALVGQDLEDGLNLASLFTGASLIKNSGTGSALKSGFQQIKTELQHNISALAKQHDPFPVLAGGPVGGHVAPTTLPSRVTSSAPYAMQASEKPVVKTTSVAPSEPSTNLPAISKVAVVAPTSPRAVLKEVNLPPIDVTLLNGETRQLPVKLYIREQDLLDPATGQPRDFTGLSTAIREGWLKSGQIAKAGVLNIDRKLQAMQQVDVFFRGESRRGLENYRVRGGGTPDMIKTDERLFIAFHAKNSRLKDLTQSPLSVSFAESCIIRPDAVNGTPITVPIGHLEPLAQGRQWLQAELNKLEDVAYQLIDNAKTPAEQVRRDSMMAQSTKQQAILEQFNHNTQGYVDSFVKYTTPGQARIVKSLSTAADDLGINRPPPALPAYTPPPGVKPIGMTTHTISADAPHAIPVNLITPKVHLEGGYQKLLVGKNGLKLQETPSLLNAENEKFFHQAVLDGVHRKGGTPITHYKLTLPAGQTISHIDLIEVGSRKIPERLELNNIFNSSYYSDARYLALAHILDVSGKEIAPIALKSALYPPSSKWFKEAVANGTLDAKSPFFLIMERRPIYNLNKQYGEELPILAQHIASQMDATGVKSATSPGSQNTALTNFFAQRYAQIDQALNTFNQGATKYKTYAENVPKTVTEPKAPKVLLSAPPRPNDPAAHPSVLPPGQDAVTLLIDGQVKRTPSPPYTLVEMARVHLPAPANDYNAIPVDLVLPKESVESNIYEKIVTQHGGLTTKRTHSLLSTMDMEAFRKTVVETVYSSGGWSRAKMSTSMQAAVSSVTLIDLGPRKVSDDIFNSNMVNKNFSDERFLMVAHMKNTAGVEMKPLAIGVSLYRPGSKRYEQAVARGELAKDAPFLLNINKDTVTNLPRELASLGKHAEDFRQGGAVMHNDSMLRPPKDVEGNNWQYRLFANRYEQVYQAWKEFMQESQQYLNPEKTLAPDKAVTPPETPKPLDALSSNPADTSMVNYLEHPSAREVVMQQIALRMAQHKEQAAQYS